MSVDSVLAQLRGGKEVRLISSLSGGAAAVLGVSGTTYSTLGFTIDDSSCFVAVESDNVVVESDNVAWESDNVVVESDNVAWESDNVVVESDNVVVESDNVVVKSDSVVVESDNVAWAWDLEFSAKVEVSSVHCEPSSNWRLVLTSVSLFSR